MIFLSFFLKVSLLAGTTVFLPLLPPLHLKQSVFLCVSLSLTHGRQQHIELNKSIIVLCGGGGNARRKERRDKRKREREREKASINVSFVQWLPPPPPPPAPPAPPPPPPASVDFNSTCFIKVLFPLFSLFPFPNQNATCVCVCTCARKKKYLFFYLGNPTVPLAEKSVKKELPSSSISSLFPPSPPPFQYDRVAEGGGGGGGGRGGQCIINLTLLTIPY